MLLCVRALRMCTYVYIVCMCVLTVAGQRIIASSDAIDFLAGCQAKDLPGIGCVVWCSVVWYCVVFCCVLLCCVVSCVWCVVGRGVVRCGVVCVPMCLFYGLFLTSRWSGSHRLAAMGVTTCSELQQVPLSKIQASGV